MNSLLSPVPDGRRAAAKLAICLIVLLGGLTVRSWWVQTHPTEARLRAVAQMTQRPIPRFDGARLLREMPYRGAIQDRAGRSLALSWYSHRLTVDGRSLVDVRVEEDGLRDDLTEVGLRLATDRILTALADGNVPVDRAETSSRLAEAVRGRDAHRVLVVGLDPDQTRRVGDRLNALLQSNGLPKGIRLVRSALGYEPELCRSYPYGRWTSQVVGSFGGVEEDASGLMAGRGGVEQQANGILSGSPGVMGFERDGRGIGLMLEPRVLEPRRPGADLVLTIDAEVQRICLETLRDVVAARGNDKASAVVLSAKTGEILAACTWPSPDPEQFGSSPVDHPTHLRCGAIQDLYEPGSVIKPVIVSYALQNNLVDMDESWDCGGPDGVHYFGRRRVKEFKPNPDPLTTEGVLIKSSNVAMARMVLERMTLRSVFEAFEAFRLAGAIPLAYSYGEVPFHTTPDQVENHPSYSVVNTGCSFAQGYEIMLSPLGMARMYLPFAGDGMLPEPTLLREIRYGSEVAGARRNVRRVIDADVAFTIRNTLRLVVEEGTGQVLKGLPWTVAAKTGTPKITGTTTYNPTVCAIAPASNPEIVVAVVVPGVVPNGQGEYTGGRIAGPVARTIIERTLGHLRVPPDR